MATRTIIKRWWILGLVAMLVVLSFFAANRSVPPAQASTVWNVGDVFVGVAIGSYKVYDNAGVFKETLADPLALGGFTTGCAFNPGLTTLYTTYNSAGRIVKYDNLSPLHTASSFVSVVTRPESIVFKSGGGYYVGHPGGPATIQEYSAADVPGPLHAVGSTGGTGGTDWIDVAANGTTIFYTQEGPDVLVFDTVAGQLAAFSTGTLTSGFALRLLPTVGAPGSAGLLVADLFNIKRLTALGAVGPTYDAAGEDHWFSLNLDPNGTSFWAGDFGTNNFYRFNIATGLVEVGPINTGAGTALFGICVKGEKTAGIAGDKFMTGGGKIVGSTATHGFELHCTTSQGPNNLQVNWKDAVGKQHRFHLGVLTSASCSDNPAIVPNPPPASFDTYVGAGTGLCDGQPGATATWTFTDAGEPGTSDTGTINIVGCPVAGLAITGPLTNGNHQAHNE